MQDPQQVESERQQQGQRFVHQERGQALQVVIGQAVGALEQLHLASGQSETQTLTQILHQTQRIGTRTGRRNVCILDVIPPESSSSHSRSGSSRP